MTTKCRLSGSPSGSLCPQYVLRAPGPADSLPWPGYESTIHVMAATISSLRDPQDSPKLMISKPPNFSAFRQPHTLTHDPQNRCAYQI